MIYVLADHDGVPRYVGRAKNVRQRYGDHIGGRAKTSAEPWLASIWPRMPLLTIVDDDDSREWHWIRELRWFGCPLLNRDTGPPPGRKTRNESVGGDVPSRFRDELTDAQFHAATLERARFKRKEIARQCGMSEARVAQWRTDPTYREAAGLPPLT